jgi:AmmeMemoRadiSam system protein B
MVAIGYVVNKGKYLSIRKSIVNGQFYPSEKFELTKYFKYFNQILDAHVEENSDILNLNPRAVIVPHAGYIYSGFSANIAFRCLCNNNTKTIVVIGPSHRISFSGISISDYNFYETPFGDLKINTDLVKLLKSKFNIDFFDEVHKEHSTEVQMPFIKYYLENVKVVEIIYSNESSYNLSKIIEFILEDKSNLIVISTDLSHFHDIDTASGLDSVCIEAVKNLDEKALHLGCEACGKIGIEAMLISAKNLALKSKVLDYRTSADITNDNSNVVGYMSSIFI